jgi:hypothetical protein
MRMHAPVHTTLPPEAIALLVKALPLMYLREGFPGTAYRETLALYGVNVKGLIVRGRRDVKIAAC